MTAIEVRIKLLSDLFERLINTSDEDQKLMIQHLMKSNFEKVLDEFNEAKEAKGERKKGTGYRLS